MVSRKKSRNDAKSILTGVRNLKKQVRKTVESIPPSSGSDARADNQEMAAEARELQIKLAALEAQAEALETKSKAIK